jgi:hypothetical protein
VSAILCRDIKVEGGLSFNLRGEQRVNNGKRQKAAPDKPKRKVAPGTGDALNIEQSCGYLGGVSAIFLAKRRLDGTGPRFRKIGGRVIYLKRDLDEYLDRCVRRSTSDAGKKAA